MATTTPSARRWMPLIGLAGMALFVMGANDDCGPVDEAGAPDIGQEVECEVAADCGVAFQAPATSCDGGWSCDGGACSWFCEEGTSCVEDADCGDGACVDGACQSVSPSPEPGACEVDQDCPGGSCVDGSCEARDGPDGCEDATDCGDGRACEGGACVPIEEPAECRPTGCSGEICAAGPVASPCVVLPWYECLELTECGSYGADGACGWKRTDAFEACMEQYEEPPPPVECDSDAVCDEGRVCVSGRCVPDEEPPPPVECDSDADCPEGASCRCTQDPDCPACAVCFFQCVPDEEPPPPAECKVSGCSGEVCSAEIEYTTCVYEPWFECLQYTKCGPYGDGGSCGWAETEAFAECLADLEEPSEDVCYGDQDCPDDSRCNAAEVCLPPPGCEDGQDCPAVCTGWCVEDEDPSEEVCYGDQDCPDDSRCNAAEVCLPPPGCEPNAPCPDVCTGWCVEDQEPPEYDCKEDADCDDDAYCALEICAGCVCPPGDDCDHCGCWGRCKPKDDDSAEACLSDDACAEGEVCNTQDYCLAPPWCDEGQPCPAVCYGKCEEAPPSEADCTEDADCPEGQLCDIQACATCDCPDGGMDCACPPELGCWGTCTEKPDDEPTQCKANADCAKGEVCKIGPCPMGACTPDYCPPCYGTCEEPDEPAPTKCMVTGCSGTVCAAEPVYTTCEYEPWYACYQYAKCGLGEDGTCGWSKSEAFEACLKEMGGAR